MSGALLQATDPSASRAAAIEALGRLAREALTHWNLRDAEIRLLKYRENAVFAVRERSTSRRWVLRVHRADYHSDAAIRSELQWMQALHEAGIEVPLPQPTRHGELLVHVAHPESAEQRQCDLLAWVEGTPIGSIEGGTDGGASAQVEHDHHQAGRLSALIHEHGRRWTPPAGFVRPRMDAEGLVGRGGYLGHYSALRALGAGDLDLLDRASTRIRQRLRAFGETADRFGLIHGDFLPENLLRDGSTVRLIDFDDCGYGWHLMDMATSLFFLLGEPAYPVVERGFVTGYRCVRPLPDTHLEMLPTFLLARGISYLGWCATRQETPEAQALGPAVAAQVLRLAADYLAA